MFLAFIPARHSGQLQTSDGWLAIPILFMVHYCAEQHRSCLKYDVDAFIAAIAAALLRDSHHVVDVWLLLRAQGKPVHTPDAGAYWRVIEEHNVRVQFCAPTALRAIKREDPHGEFLKKHGRSGCCAAIVPPSLTNDAFDLDVGCMRAMFLAGERADTDTVKWAQSLLGVPVIDHYWQTESGYPIIANVRVLSKWTGVLCCERLTVTWLFLFFVRQFSGYGLFATKLGSPGKPGPGYQASIQRDQEEGGGATETSKSLGDVCLKLPLPPGLCVELEFGMACGVVNHLMSGELQHERSVSESDLLCQVFFQVPRLLRDRRRRHGRQ